MTNKKLTDRQQIVYDYLKSEIKTKGYPPSVREICKSVGFNSTSSAHNCLESLEKMGYIKKSPLKNRSIEILEKDFYTQRRDLVNIPIIGQVTAGLPILAVENVEDTFTISSDFINSEDVFMLRIKGNSMINAGIHDRDLVIINPQKTASNGEIVVALVEDSATVKRFYKTKDKFILKPENDEFNEIILDNVEILGKVVGLYRTVN